MNQVLKMLSPIVTSHVIQSIEKDNDNINDKAIDENLDVQIVEDGDIRMAVVFRYTFSRVKR